MATQVSISGTVGYNVIANSGGTLNLSGLSPSAGSVVVIVAYIRDSIATINIPTGFTDITNHVRDPAGLIQVTMRVFARYYATAVSNATYSVTFTGAGTGDVAIATHFLVLNSLVENISVSTPITANTNGVPGTVIHDIQSFGSMTIGQVIVGIYGEADDRANAVMTGKVTTNGGASWTNSGNMSSAVKTAFLNAATTTGTDGTLGVSYWVPVLNLPVTLPNTYYGISLDDTVSGLNFTTGMLMFALLIKPIAPSYTYSGNTVIKMDPYSFVSRDKKLRAVDLAWSAEPIKKERLSGQYLICSINGTAYPATSITIRRQLFNRTSHSVSLTIKFSGELYDVINDLVNIDLVQKLSGYNDIFKTLVSGAVIKSARVDGIRKQTEIEATKTAVESNRFSGWVPKDIQYRSVNSIRCGIDWDVRPGDTINGGVSANTVVCVAQLGNIWFTQVDYGQG